MISSVIVAGLSSCTKQGSSAYCRSPDYSKIEMHAFLPSSRVNYYPPTILSLWLKVKAHCKVSNVFTCNSTVFLVPISFTVSTTSSKTQLLPDPTEQASFKLLVAQFSNQKVEVTRKFQKILQTKRTKICGTWLSCKSPVLSRSTLFLDTHQKLKSKKKPSATRIWVFCRLCFDSQSTPQLVMI